VDVLVSRLLVALLRRSIDWVNTVEIMLLVACSKSGGRLFWRQVPLRLCEQFISRCCHQLLISTLGCNNVPDEEFAHAGATQKRRVEVQVQMDISTFVACAGGCCKSGELVNSHRISK